jgi:drug/metabolite transporter (DMT)-like permease
MKKAFINLHLAIFFAGFTGVLGRLISLNEIVLVWYRLLITVCTLCAFFLFRRSFPVMPVRSVIKIFGVGIVVALHWVAFYGSIKYSNVSIALVSFSTLGFFSAALEPVLLKKKLSITEMMLGLVAVAGVYLIFHFDSRFKTGILFGIASAVLAAFFTILNKKVLGKHDASGVTFYELSGGLIVLSMIMPFYLAYFNLEFSLPQQGDWLWLLILSWLCTVWAFYLSLSALRTISPFTVNLSYNLEPVYGIALAFFIYHENQELGVSFYAGLLLIIIAVILQMLRIYHGRRPLSI